MLVYSSITSLDGYINDAEGHFDWGEPSAELHQFVNDLQRDIGIHLYGRKLYEVMVWWETIDLDDQPEVFRDFARGWRAAEKVVYSTTLTEAASARTRICPVFDADEIRRMPGDQLIGGAVLAGEAFTHGLVDEIHQFVMPVVIGGGTRALPDDVTLDLELLDQRGFDGGAVYLRYRVLR